MPWEKGGWALQSNYVIGMSLQFQLYECDAHINGNNNFPTVRLNSPAGQTNECGGWKKES